MSDSHSVGVPFDGSDQQTECKGIEHTVPPVEMPSFHFYGIIGQEPATQHKRGNPHRQIDGEKPRPRGDGEESGGQRGPCCRRDSHDQCIDPHSPSQKVPGIDNADQGGVDAGDGRRTEPLQHPGQRERRQRARQGTGQRGKGEDDQSGNIDFPVPDHVAQRRERQQRDHRSQLVGVHHPNGGGRAGIQIGCDGRQGHIGDRPVEHGKRDPHRNGENRPIAPGDRQIVRRSARSKIRTRIHRTSFVSGFSAPSPGEGIRKTDAKIGNPTPLRKNEGTF